MSTHLARIAFFVSLFVGGVFYGLYASHTGWFPYEQVKEAQEGVDALMDLYVKAQLPGSFRNYATPKEPFVRVTGGVAEGSGDELILITGGPYENLAECPHFGCLAWIVDRSGKVLHHWEVDLDSVFKDVHNVTGLTRPESFKPLGLKLMDDGGLLAAFFSETTFPVAAGLARFDRDGKLVWFNDLNLHHWFTLGPDGTIYVPGLNVVDSPVWVGDTGNQIKCPKLKMTLDYVALIDPSGKLKKRIEVADLLHRNGYDGVLHGTTDPCDPFHLNFVQYIDGDIAAKLNGVEAGDLMISLRNVNTVLIFDPETLKIKWLSHGHYIHQHSPRFLPDGSIVVFDNLGGPRQGHGKESRIVREWIGSGETAVVASARTGASKGRFSSEYAGHISVSRDGKRLLTAVTQRGLIEEIDLATGKTLWTYRKLFPTKGYPGADTDRAPYVTVEAYGSDYIDRQRFAKLFPDGQ